MQTADFDLDSTVIKPKDLKGFYRNANFDAVCADILDGIRERRGFVLLTGETGMGKTSVLRRCIAEADDIRFVLLNNPKLDFPDLILYLCSELELPTTGLNTEQLGQRLLESLADHARRNQIIALLVDDAHYLRPSALSRLWEFVAVPLLPSHRLQIVLAGLPEIEGQLRQPDLLLVRDSIQVQCRLEYLNNADTRLFIKRQFELAHRQGRQTPTPEVIARIAQFCQGNPRTIALLCDAILLFASMESDHQITPELVDIVARDCFLGERTLTPATPIPAVATASPPGLVGDADLETDLPDLNFPFDADTAQPPPVAVPASTLTLEPTATATAPPAVHPAPTVAPEVVAMAELPTSPPLRAFALLLEEVIAKQGRLDNRERATLGIFYQSYAQLLQGASRARLTECEWRLARLAQTQQPVLVMLAVATQPDGPQRGGVLFALLINPTWWQYREIRLRVQSQSPDLTFSNNGQAVPLRLLSGRDAHPVFLDFHRPDGAPTQAVLRLELELRDHRGEWHVYASRREIRLDLPLRPDAAPETSQPPGGEPQIDHFWLPSESGRTDGVWGFWLLNAPVAVGGLAHTLPLELELEAERTQRLRTTAEQTLVRGMPLTRALLLSANPAQAPARIELVSRPFMVLGRYNAVTGIGFGDFALGFVPNYDWISRLHGVICALGDQLALMPTSNQGHTYTSRNGERLERGCWEFLETQDILDICGLYKLRLSLAWDDKGDRNPPGWDTQEPRDKFGRFVLDLVDVLQQRDPRAKPDETQSRLQDRYRKLLRMQERVAALNGVGSPGSLLYARFEREDEAGQQVVHYYLPKWLSLGSAPQAGLRINADDVAPQHAELLLRDGLYWIQNLAKPGSVRVGCHGLATNEAIALEAGDVLAIGAARFTFQAY